MSVVSLFILPVLLLDLWKGELTPDFNELVMVMQNAKFKGIDYGLETYKEYQTNSISEVNAKKIFESESGPRIISYTNHFMVKVYPAYYRQDSSNLNAVEYWNYGFQKGNPTPIFAGFDIC